jgi:hypothetical protein
MDNTRSQGYTGNQTNRIACYSKEIEKRLEHFSDAIHVRDQTHSILSNVL